ncbi:MAG: AraC-like DNA-binding protein [Flavobacteriaceae bacterium]|jgi:AraC-like DNA-binding protein
MRLFRQTDVGCKLKKMKIYIKNMVCNRCKMVVKSTLKKLGLVPVQVELGEVVLEENDISPIKEQLKQELQSLGFDLLDDKRTKTIEKIKNLIVNLVQNKNSNLQITLSDYLTKELHRDYSALSNLFSQVEGITIEKYYIFQKIEKVKELLVYDELTLSEIAFQLNYSSVAYLSNQFKKVTGLTPSHFKKMRTIKRRPLDEL